MKDITNQVFGSLTAISLSHLGKKNVAYWNYQCVCGKIHTARANTVTYEAKRKNDPELPSCGCIELARKTKHGYRKVSKTHPLYRAFQSMRNRCHRPNTKGYEHYGAKGVTVCQEWLDDPMKFIQWSLDNNWKEGYEIDKDILSDKLGIHPHMYSPQTCMWIEPSINNSYSSNRDNYGRHKNIKLSHEDVNEIRRLYYSGEITNKSELARMYGVVSSSIHRLL